MSRWRTDPLLEIEHLTMRFGGLTAVSDVSFTVGRGDITALIGPNGAGKTTVFNCVTGFYKPTAGRITLTAGRGIDAGAREALTNSGARYRGDVYLLERMADHEINRQARIARTFQNIRLFAGMTVLENLMVAQHRELMRASGWSLLGLVGAASFRKAEAEGLARAVEWLDLIGLTNRADEPAGELSYGDQRRLEIARAMCTGPRLLCLDEPAAGLNPRESAELTKLLRTIRARYETSILLIEHDMSVVMDVSDHVVVLEYGTKISDGTADEVKNDPRVIAAYLGVPDEDVAAVEREVAR